MKKWFLNLLIAFIFMLLFFLPVKHFFSSGMKISVLNATAREISGLEITYYYNEEKIVIPALKPNEEHEITIVPDEDFSESFMQLVYTDQTGKLRQEMIFGYFEKGYKGTAKVTVKSVNSKGVITFNVNEELSVY
ncbi:hypothetical protein RFW18_09400 [Metabacillus idriensis]|uniref:hypothetical protein n=1 Tax=Metabacillus idriensis TaxID=324768 RepID=UPI0028135F4F|nr:hypothetical protein [Metabacillus idriensis]MDR0137955.1 hypothetical protein [Metabacillus idriensis]